MGVLRTIVATAVIVFTLTTAAMAGVQHFTNQDRQAAPATHEAAPAITLTDVQLDRLLSAQHQTVRATEADQTRSREHTRDARTHAEQHARTQSTQHLRTQEHDGLESGRHTTERVRTQELQSTAACSGSGHTYSDAHAGRGAESDDWHGERHVDGGCD